MGDNDGAGAVGGAGGCGGGVVCVAYAAEKKITAEVTLDELGSDTIGFARKMI